MVAHPCYTSTPEAERSQGQPGLRDKIGETGASLGYMSRLAQQIEALVQKDLMT